MTRDLTHIEPRALEIAGKIAAAVQPKQIILFGSRARGDARPDSDYDFLLIYDGPLNHHDCAVAAHRAIGRRRFSVDVMVQSSEDFEYFRHARSSIANHADREGVICHG